MDSSPLSGADAREARIALGVSQSAVANRIGVNRTYLSLFESGRFILPVDAADRLREWFDEQGRDTSSGATARRGTTPRADALSTAKTDRELSTLRAEIASLLGATVEPGFLWGVDEDDRDEKVARATPDGTCFPLL